MIGRMGKWGKFDFFSLRSRLTFGIASISTAGLGSIAIWTSWQMQHILIDSHKQGIDYIAGRLPHDVKLYSEMMPQEAALLKAIDNLTTANTYIWIKHHDGTIKVKSATLNIPSAQKTAAGLISLTQMPPLAEVYAVNGRYACIVW